MNPNVPVELQIDFGIFAMILLVVGCSMVARTLYRSYRSAQTRKAINRTVREWGVNR